MRPYELREMTDQELELRLGEVEKELFNLKFQKTTGQLENPMTLRTVRRELARVKTIIRERKDAGSTATGGR